MKELLIGSSERLLCLAEVAENPWTRGRGLLGRKELPAGRALWIRPGKSVHTFCMGFPIDLAYLAADGTVVKTCSRLQPFRFSTGGRRAHSVLELPAGFLDHMQVVVGEKLAVTPATGKAADVQFKERRPVRKDIANSIRTVADTAFPEVTGVSTAHQHGQPISSVDPAGLQVEESGARFKQRNRQCPHA